jgi:DNA-directed RNA polymerase specialized sigma24 family protein
MLDEYLIKNYDRLKDVAINIAGVKEYEELLHFVIEELYKCDQIRYAVRVMINQFHSNTSRYYYKYKKYYEYHTTQTIESISIDNYKSTKKQKEQDEIKLKWIEEKLKDLYWFDAEVFKLYYKENFSLSEMAKATKINKNTLYKAIRNVKNYLINER